jgi:transcriptional regulator with XRE-family HTH domain
MNDPDSPFNEAIVEARTESGLTQKEVAQRAGFTVGFVRSYEDCAKNPTMRTMFLFAFALGLKITIDKDGVTIESKEGALLLDKWDPRPGKFNPDE